MDITQILNVWGSDILIVTITIAILLTLGKIVYHLLSKKLKKMASLTKTSIDDKILEAVHKIIYFILFLFGLHLGIKFTKFSTIYSAEIDKLFLIAWTILICVTVIKVIDILIWHYKNRFGRGLAQFFSKINKIVIGLFALVIILHSFDIEISPIIASLGIAGLAVALALQDTLANFFSGIYLTADQPIRPGDFIEIAGQNVSGEVLNVGWRSTRMRRPDGNIIIIPNKRLSESIIINYNIVSPEVVTSVKVDVSYNDDPKKVERILKEVAIKIRDKMEQCVKDFEPRVRFEEFGASGLKFLVLLKVKKRGDQFVVAPELRKAIFERFKEEGITIPYPITEVHLKKENEI